MLDDFTEQQARREDIRSFYTRKNDLIMKASKRGRFGVDVYSLDWEPDWIKSPPEHSVWIDLRCCGVPLYPQYPVLNFFLDYGDPYRKIGLEVDGKEFHNVENDRIRDEKLWAEGWRIFRIPARETYSRFAAPDSEFPIENEWEAREHLREWVMDSSSGIVRAIKAVYFQRWTPEQHATWYGLSGELGAFLRGLYEQTLIEHRLISFPLFDVGFPEFDSADTIDI